MLTQPLHGGAYWGPPQKAMVFIFEMTYFGLVPLYGHEYSKYMPRIEPQGRTSTNMLANMPAHLPTAQEKLDREKDEILKAELMDYIQDGDSPIRAAMKLAINNVIPVEKAQVLLDELVQEHGDGMTSTEIHDMLIGGNLRTLQRLFKHHANAGLQEPQDDDLPVNQAAVRRMAQDAARTAVGLHKAILDTVGLRDAKYSPKTAPGVQINITGDPKNVKAVEALLGHGNVEDAEEIESEDDLHG